MIKVLYINHSSGIGGAETNLLNILRYRNHLSVEAVAVILPGQGPLVNSLQVQNIRLGFVDYYGLRLTSPWRFMQTIRQLCQWVIRTKADVIHLNHEYLVDYACWTGRLTGRPVVCHVRNLDSAQFIHRNRHHFAGVARLIAISKTVQTHLVAHGVTPANIDLIYDGIDVHRFEFGASLTGLRSEWGISSDSPVVGFVGRLVQWKGVEDLIHAAPLVLAAVPKVIFVVVGDDEEDGQYTEHLRSMTRKCLVDRAFHFVGFRSDIPDVLQNLDMIVLPSHQEPLGNIVLEAMAAGRLVVTTNDGGAAEVICDEETGFLVPPREPVKLAAQIVRGLHLERSVYRQMAQTARRAVKHLYSIQRQVSDLEALYKRTVRDGNK